MNLIQENIKKENENKNSKKDIIDKFISKEIIYFLCFIQYYKKNIIYK